MAEGQNHAAASAGNEGKLKTALALTGTYLIAFEHSSIQIDTTKTTAKETRHS